MSLTLYDFGGLRFWREREIRLREQIADQIAYEIMTTLRGINPGWSFERVEAPLIMPRARLNPNYTRDDAFFLADPMGDEEMVLRAETTDGSYLMAEHLLRSSRVRPPLGIWQLGQSFRRELSDGASAANLRFNSFYQLEFQLIYAKPVYAEMTEDDFAKKAEIESQGGEYQRKVIKGTGAPIPKLLKEMLVPLVAKMTGLEARLVPSDRLPSYSESTDDIEVFYHAPTKDEGEWKEVCSMSQRTDFNAQISGVKDELTVFEIAFGADRMVAVSQGNP